MKSAKYRRYLTCTSDDRISFASESLECRCSLVVGDMMINRYNPMRLTADLSLLKTDAQQLRLHLRWLLADMQEQQGQVSGQAEAFRRPTNDITTFLPRLEELDT